MITNTLIVIGIGIALYLILGFTLISDKSFVEPLKASIFNRQKKNIYASDINEKLKKNVVSREQYEWIKSERFGVPIGDNQQY